MFVQANMTQENGRLYFRFCDGEAAHDGLLDDYAVYVLALIELYDRTFDTKHLKTAVFYAKQMLDLFEDRDNGGF